MKYRKLKITLIAIFSLLAILTIAFFVYTGSYYHANASSVDYLSSTNTVTVTLDEDGTYIFMPQNKTACLIFYQGAKVENTAYAKLLYSLADQGIACVLPKMPFNLAVLNINAASKYIDEFKGTTSIYIGGHSLGGSMAGVYANKNSDSLEGLVLLGSYSSVDLSSTELKVLSIYGSLDRVLNKENYQKYLVNYPKSFSQFEIEGGNHAQFGTYGTQKGDGDAEITSDEQIAIAVKQIVNFINN